MQALLFRKNEEKAVSKMQKKIDSKFAEIGGDIKVGDKVKMKNKSKFFMIDPWKKFIY